MPPDANCSASTNPRRHDRPSGAHVQAVPARFGALPHHSGRLAIRRDVARCLCCAHGSISVGSSSGARELFARLDTGQRGSMPFAAGTSKAVSPSLSRAPKFARSSDTGMRSCRCSTAGAYPVRCAMPSVDRMLFHFRMKPRSKKFKERTAWRTPLISGVLARSVPKIGTERQPADEVSETRTGYAATPGAANFRNG